MPAIQYGIYAVAGMSGKDALKSPLFYFVRRKFNRRGFSTDRLNSLWQEIDVSPDRPPEQSVAFVMVLGKRDRLVRYEKALATLQAWQKAGVPIKIITLIYLTDPRSKITVRHRLNALMPAELKSNHLPFMRLSAKRLSQYDVLYHKICIAAVLFHLIVVYTCIMSEFGERGVEEARIPSIEYYDDGVAFIERGGRRLAFERQGDPNGTPVLFMHGMPGSRKGTYLSSELLNGLGVNLISYDRPGYGRSSRREGRTIADSAEDVRNIADALGLNKIGIMGRSGGVAHALACAALLPDRVSEVAVQSGMASLHAMGPSWYEGMAESNIAVFGATNDQEVIDEITERAAAVRQNPANLLAGLGSELIPVDSHFTSGAFRSLFEASVAEAVAQGPGGWIDDVLALRREWGFDLASIRVPVHFQQGSGDQFTPSSHTLWMQRQIPGSTVDVQDLSHFDPGLDLIQRFAHPTEYAREAPTINSPRQLLTFY
jgi:pimeloyl-ACP methyl ester carboxylesterase